MELALRDFQYSFQSLKVREIIYEEYVSFILRFSTMYSKLVKIDGEKRAVQIFSHRTERFSQIGKIKCKCIYAPHLYTKECVVNVSTCK